LQYSNENELRKLLVVDELEQRKEKKEKKEEGDVR